MPGKTQSILLGAAIVGIIVPLTGLLGRAGQFIGCLMYLVAGLIVVWHYTSTNELTIPTGSGAGMGALGGLAAALIGTVVSFTLIEFGLLPGIEESIDKMYEQGYSDEQIEASADFLRSTWAKPLMIGIGIVIGTIGGAIGGAIGAPIFKKGGDDDGF